MINPEHFFQSQYQTHRNPTDADLASSDLNIFKKRSFAPLAEKEHTFRRDLTEIPEESDPFNQIFTTIDGMLLKFFKNTHNQNSITSIGTSFIDKLNDAKEAKKNKELNHLDESDLYQVNFTQSLFYSACIDSNGLKNLYIPSVYKNALLDDLSSYKNQLFASFGAVLAGFDTLFSSVSLLPRVLPITSQDTEWLKSLAKPNDGLEGVDLSQFEQSNAYIHGAMIYVYGADDTYITVGKQRHFALVARLVKPLFLEYMKTLESDTSIKQWFIPPLKWPQSYADIPQDKREEINNDSEVQDILFNRNQTFNGMLYSLNAMIQECNPGFRNVLIPADVSGKKPKNIVDLSDRQLSDLFIGSKLAFYMHSPLGIFPGIDLADLCAQSDNTFDEKWNSILSRRDSLIEESL